MEDKVVPMLARAEVCAIYIIIFRCCWLAWEYRAPMRHCIWLKEMLLVLSDVWMRDFCGLSTDPFSRKVEEVMADKRERRCQMLVALLSTWSLFTLFLSGVRLHLGGVWGEPDMDSLREILSHPRFYGQFILVVTMIFLVPTSCSRRTVADVLHFITQMCGMVGLLFHSDVLVFWEDVSVVTVQRLFFALFGGNIQLVLALNTRAHDMSLCSHRCVKCLGVRRAFSPGAAFCVCNYLAHGGELHAFWRGSTAHCLVVVKQRDHRAELAEHDVWRGGPSRRGSQGQDVIATVRRSPSPPNQTRRTLWDFISDVLAWEWPTTLPGMCSGCQRQRPVDTCGCAGLWRVPSHTTAFSLLFQRPLCADVPHRRGPRGVWSNAAAGGSCSIGTTTAIRATVANAARCE